MNTNIALEQLVNRQVQDELLQQTRLAVTSLIEAYPHEFGLENLIIADAFYMTSVPEKLAQLYQEICDYCTENAIKFDHGWVNIIIAAVCVPTVARSISHAYRLLFACPTM